MQGAFAGQKTARKRKTKCGLLHSRIRSTLTSNTESFERFVKEPCRQKSTNFVGFFTCGQKFAMDMDERDTKRQTHSCYMDEHTRYKVLNDKYTI